MSNGLPPRPAKLFAADSHGERDGSTESHLRHVAVLRPGARLHTPDNETFNRRGGGLLPHSILGLYQREALL